MRTIHDWSASHAERRLVLMLQLPRRVSAQALAGLMPGVEWRPSIAGGIGRALAQLATPFGWASSRVWCAYVPATVATNGCRPRAEIAAVEAFVRNHHDALGMLQRRHGDCGLWLEGFATSNYDPDIRYWSWLDFGMLELQLPDPHPSLAESSLESTRFCGASIGSPLAA